MNSGATAERVYEALRRQILTRGFRPGDRLDPAALAETLASSVTPVRDALHLLAGEGLVTARTGSGFHLPPLDEPGLIDLYAWSSDVLLIAIRSWRPKLDLASKPIASSGSRGEAADRAADLFVLAASLSGNAEHAHAVSSLNARLHPVRTVEPHVLDGVDDEIGEIEVALLARDARLLRGLIMVYHRRRQRHAAEMVRAVYRA